MKTQRLTQDELQELITSFNELIPRLLASMMMAEMFTGQLGKKWQARAFLDNFYKQEHPKAVAMRPYLRLAFHGARQVTLAEMKRRLNTAVDIASTR